MSDAGDRYRNDIMSVVRRAIAAADPAASVRRCLTMRGSVLVCCGREFDLSRYRRIVAVGAGKASGRMAEALEGILAGRLDGGVVGVWQKGPEKLGTIELVEARHPVPGPGSLEAAARAEGLVGPLGERDLLFCLISGGASSLWCLPAAGLGLEDLVRVNEVLLASGADIHAINSIRKHVSAIKGGQLATAAAPATVVTLAVSDVVGDDLATIGSGPTVPDPSTFADALEAVGRFTLAESLPGVVVARLRSGSKGAVPETPKPGNRAFDRNAASVVASNRDALEAAAEEGRRLGYNVCILSSALTGEARDVGRELVEKARLIVYDRREIEVPAMLISGGETTVTVTGSGTGGRNQELVLSAAVALDGKETMWIASVGTDGRDGPTDAAGAVATGSTVRRARDCGLDAVRFLESNDSYTFFDRLGDLIRTGSTGTNVMDMQVIVCV